MFRGEDGCVEVAFDKILKRLLGPEIDMAGIGADAETAAHVVEPFEIRLARHRDEHVATGHPFEFVYGAAGIVEVFEHFAAQHGVERAVFQVAPATGPGRATPPQGKPPSAAREWHKWFESRKIVRVS